MCGILGLVGFNARDPIVDEERMRRALAMMRHRGPDGDGSWINEERTAYLGHRRLSIIDLSAAGRQPMSNEDGSIRISYNGEIYNFMELRAELQARGHRFVSRTDTEVIVHGYEEYGPAIVERLRGMFAFVLYDARARRALLARDRLGIKPLYHTWARGALAAASEIGPLFEIEGVEKRLNAAAFREYLAFGKVYAPNTMFEGITKFPAAHWALVDASGMRMQRYWTPYDEPIGIAADASADEHAAHLLGLLEESVRLRMLSDVPVGVFLSGGVDSTANVALMSRAAGGHVHTFTAGFAGQAAYDERSYARQAARHFGTRHDEIEISADDLRDGLPALASFLDEPIADPTVVPIYFLSRLARSAGAIVILNGDGGDELFCGYRKYMRYLRLAPYWRMLNMLPVWARRAVAGLGGAVGLRGSAADLLDRAARGVEMFAGGTGQLKGMRGFGEIVEGGGGAVYDAVRAGRARFRGEHRSNDYVEWLSYWGLRSEVENVFLYRADRMGMANSVEIRVPFLDQRVVSYAMQMPQGLKHRDGETKYILKRALRGVIPDELLNRRKQGFCVPLREWTGGLMDESIRATLPRIRSDWGVMSTGFAEEMIGMLGSDRADSDGALSWMLYNLAVWYEQWFR